MSLDWYWAVKSTLHTLPTYSRGPCFGLFHSTTTRFRDTRLSKLGIHSSEWPPNNLEHLNLKSTLEVQILVSFIVPSVVFEIQGCQKWEKWEMHWITTNWPSSPRVPCIHEILTPEDRIMVRFALQPTISWYQAVENRKSRKCTELPHNDLGHLTVKRNLHYSCMYIH